MLVTQDENELLDYEVDWSAFLNPGDTIATATFTGQTGITLTNISYTTTTATVWVSGGTVNNSYTVVCDIVTAQGRKAERTLIFQIKQL